MKAFAIAVGGCCGILTVSAAAAEAHVGFSVALLWLFGSVVVPFALRRDPPGEDND